MRLPRHPAWADGKGRVPPHPCRCGARRGRRAGSLSAPGPQTAVPSAANDSEWVALRHCMSSGANSPKEACAPITARNPGDGVPHETRSRHSLARTGTAARRRDAHVTPASTRTSALALFPEQDTARRRGPGGVFGKRCQPRIVGGYRTFAAILRQTRHHHFGHRVGDFSYDARRAGVHRCGKHRCHIVIRVSARRSIDFLSLSRAYEDNHCHKTSRRRCRGAPYHDRDDSVCYARQLPNHPAKSNGSTRRSRHDGTATSNHAECGWNTDQYIATDDSWVNSFSKLESCLCLRRSCSESSERPTKEIL